MGCDPKHQNETDRRGSTLPSWQCSSYAEMQQPRQDAPPKSTSITYRQQQRPNVFSGNMMPPSIQNKNNITKHNEHRSRGRSNPCSLKLDIQSRALRHGLAYDISQYTYRLSEIKRFWSHILHFSSPLRAICVSTGKVVLPRSKLSDALLFCILIKHAHSLNSACGVIFALF